MGSELTPEVLADLRAKAIAATPGPWTTYVLDHGTEARVVGDGWVVAQCASIGAPQVAHDATYIAAANPATVLALLDEIKRMRDGLTDALIARADFRDEAELLRADYAEATAELDRIRENNDAIISGSLASHLAAAEVKDAMRDAFDAGARAMRDAVLEQGDDATHAPDIANLPGRPE